MKDRLHILKWGFLAISLAAILANWTFEPRGNQALLLFGIAILAGVPAAMLSLHLGQPRWLFDRMERR